MKRGFRLFFAAGALAMVSRAVVGCATNDDSNEVVEPPANGDDAALGEDAPSTPDAAVPLDAHAEADAPASTCTAEGWCYTSLPEEGSFDASALIPSLPGVKFELRSVWVDPDRRPWAVSSAGHVLRWDGATWRVEAIVSGSPRVIWGWGTTDLWIGGERGLILHGTIAGGKVTFEKVTIGTTQTILRIAGTSATDVWAIPDGLNSSGGTLNRVFRLSAAGNTMVPTTVPGTFIESVAKLRLSSLWTSGSEVWVAGYESVCAGPSPCKFQDGLVAIKWVGGADAGTDSGAPSWEHVRLRRSYTNPIAAGAGTNDGVQLAVIRGDGDNGHVVRIADDEAKLEGAPGADAGITDAGAYSWTSEHAVTHGSPAGLWATDRNNVWLVGKSGVIRHFDGKEWQLVRLALTQVTPLLNDLHAIDAVVSPSGEQDIWVVGNDVALHRTVKP